MLCNLVEEMERKGHESIVVSNLTCESDISIVPRIEKTSRFVHLKAPSFHHVTFRKGFQELLRQEQPDIIQTWMHTAGVAAGFLAKSAGFPNIVWAIHSKDFFRFNHRPLLTKTFGRLLGFSGRLLPRSIVSVSRIGIDIHCSEYGYPRSKMQWIGNGIDLTRFSPSESHRTAWRRTLGLQKDDFLIGMVARFHPVKDIPTYLRAASKLLARKKNAHFVFCGEPLEQGNEEIQSLVSALPDRERFHWIGFQAKPEEIFPMFDLLSVTSISEAYPMVLLEAMACGVPCTSTDVGDAASIIDDPSSIVRQQDIEALAELWEHRLTESEETRNARRASARRRAEEEFGLKLCCQRYQEVYEEILAS